MSDAPQIPPGPPVRLPELKPLTAFKSEPIEWLLKHRIGRRVPKGSMTIVGGEPGTGKSQWSVAVAAALTVAGDRVVFVGSEDGIADTVRPRFIACGGDPSKFYVLTIKLGEREDTVLLPTDEEMIERALKETGATLLIVDPISGHISPEIDSHNDASLRRALIPLANVTRRAGVATICVMHRSKAGSERSALNSLNGSTAFGGVARSVLFFGRVKGRADEAPLPGKDYREPRALLHVKCNGARLAKPLLTYLEGRTIEDEGRFMNTSFVHLDGAEDDAIEFKDLY